MNYIYKLFVHLIYSISSSHLHSRTSISNTLSSTLHKEQSARRGPQ